MRVPRFLLAVFGGLYNELFGRRSRLGAAAVVFDGDGRVLLVQHSYGRRNWELPGGGRELHESAEEAVRREAREEVGVEVIVERLCGVYYEPQFDQHHFTFLCRLADGALPRATSPEILACGYFALDELPRPISAFTLRRLRDAGSGSAPTWVPHIERGQWLE